MAVTNEKQIRSSTRLNWLGGICVIGVLLVMSLVCWLLYQKTVDLLTDNLRQRLLSIAITEAANIDAKDLDALKEEKDWKKPQWAKVVKGLKAAKDTNSNIVFMYIYRKVENDPTKMVFVADAESINPYANSDNDPTNDVDANHDGKIEPDGADYLQWPGQEYDSPPEEAFAAYSGPLTSKNLYEDSYGKVMTGYAPIKDSTGKIVAILGTDIKAGDFLTVTSQTLYPFLLFITFLVISIVFLSIVLIRLWGKQIEIFAELDKQKDELLGIVSHQLAKPITALKWNLEILLDGDLRNVAPERLEMLESMQKVTHHLTELVNMILDVSRIQLGKIVVDPQSLDLKEFFEEIDAVIQPSVKEKRIHYVKNLPQALPTIRVDKKYLRMTVENLLSNAIKYTPENGTVEMTLTVTNEKIAFKVQDTGCGIPKADQKKIFGKLFRASNVRNTVDGNGFGLYVAKGAIEAQGGKLGFESEEGKGTTFEFELPRRKA